MNPPPLLIAHGVNRVDDPRIHDPAIEIDVRLTPDNDVVCYHGSMFEVMRAPFFKQWWPKVDRAHNTLAEVLAHTAAQTLMIDIKDWQVGHYNLMIILDRIAELTKDFKGELLVGGFSPELHKIIANHTIECIQIAYEPPYNWWPLPLRRLKRYAQNGANIFILPPFRCTQKQRKNLQEAKLQLAVSNQGLREKTKQKLRTKAAMLGAKYLLHFPDKKTP